MTRDKSTMSGVEVAASQQFRWLIAAIVTGFPAAISGAMLLIAWSEMGSRSALLSLSLSVSNFIITLVIFAVSAAAMSYSCWMGSRWEKEEVRQERLQEEQLRENPRERMKKERERLYGISR